jgi:hypothetical protein
MMDAAHGVHGDDLTKKPVLAAGWLAVPKLPLVAKAEQTILPTAATTPAPL